jgi:3-hydroxybutyryl-CoA dehydratase
MAGLVPAIHVLLVLPPRKDVDARERRQVYAVCARLDCAAGMTARDEGPAMQDFYVKVGDSVTFAKTVGETDIYLFAGITGDFSVNHVNEQYMAKSKFGRRIAHGALIIGYMSTCSTMMIEKCNGATLEKTPVSLGYDRVRFLGPVFIGDTVTLTYTIAEVDARKEQSVADISVVNQDGVLVAIARHVLRWVTNAAPAGE